MKHHLPTLSGAPLFAHLDGQANTHSFWSAAFFFSKKWENPQKLNLMKPINKKTSRILLMLCAFFFLASHMAMAKTYTSVKSGNFNDCTVWKTMLLEQSGNDVFVIASGHTVTVPRNVKMYLSKLVLTDATSRVILTDATSVLSTTGRGTTLNCSPGGSDYKLRVALDTFQSFYMTDSGALDVNFILYLVDITAGTWVSIADRDGAEEISYNSFCGPNSYSGLENPKLFFEPLWWVELDYDPTHIYEIQMKRVHEADFPEHDGISVVKHNDSDNLLDTDSVRLSNDGGSEGYTGTVLGAKLVPDNMYDALLQPTKPYSLSIKVNMDDGRCDGVNPPEWTWTLRAQLVKK